MSKKLLLSSISQDVGIDLFVAVIDVVVVVIVINLFVAVLVDDNIVAC